MSAALRPLTAPPPEVGQLAVVRNRHWVVTDVVRSSLAPDILSAGDERPQHLVELASVEDDGADADLRVVWELEPGARTLAQATIPALNIPEFGSLGAVTDSVMATADGMINQQAAMIAYINDFYLMAWISIAVLPFVILLRPPKGKMEVVHAE